MRKNLDTTIRCKSTYYANKNYTHILTPFSKESLLHFALETHSLAILLADRAHREKPQHFRPAGCSLLSWWPPAPTWASIFPWLLRAALATTSHLQGEDGHRRLLSPSLAATQLPRAAAGLLHGEDVPSAALPSPGGLPAPQGCSGPAGRLSATSRGKMAPSVALSSPGGHQLLRAALLFLPGHSGLPPVNRWRQLFWSLPESCSPVGR